MEVKKFNWPIFSFITIYHILLFALCPFYFYYTPPSVGLVIITLLLFIATGISITGGYHRLYSHRTYKTNKIIEFIFLFLGTMTGQGSALRWSHDHRLHHAHVDTDRDPYSIKKGFWYAHILWLFETPIAIDPRVVPDLVKNKLVVLQDRYYNSLFIVTNFSVFLVVGWLCSDYIGAFFLAWWMRLFLLHHSTWFINSLAHFWGAKSYCKEISAVDNYIISLITFGEGYHNYHHTFATDYRNGIRWYHFDPTKWLIWGLSKLGLADNLKRIDTYRVRKHVVKKDKDILLDWIEQISYIKKEVLEQKINNAADIIMGKISSINSLRDEYNKYKKSKDQRDTLKEIHDEIRQLKKNLRQDWKDWLELFNSVMRLKSIQIV